jgi:hypothetical protein
MPNKTKLPRSLCPVPAGRGLPKRVAPFFALVAKSAIPKRVLRTSWKHLRDLLSVVDGARDHLWPFYGLGDGGMVALWWEHDEPCVVWAGSEGDFSVLARDFDEFLARLAAGKSGVWDMDEDFKTVLLTTLLPRRPRPRPLGGVPTKRFLRWIETQSSLQKPNPSADGEKLRLELVALGKRMLRDKLSKVYTTRSPDWSFDFKLIFQKSGWRIDYLDYGVWYPLPTKYKPADLAPRIVALTKHPKRKRYEMVVTHSGLVSLDRDKELVLEDPQAPIE